MKKHEYPTEAWCSECDSWIPIVPRRDRDIFRSACIGFLKKHSRVHRDTVAKSADGKRQWYATVSVRCVGSEGNVAIIGEPRDV